MSPYTERSATKTRYVESIDEIAPKRRVSRNATSSKRSKRSKPVLATLEPLQKGALPLEIRLLIVEQFCYSDFAVLGKLLFVSKEWYQTVIGNDAQWEARCQTLAAMGPEEFDENDQVVPYQPKKRAGCTWLATYVAQYLESCLACKRHFVPSTKSYDSDDEDDRSMIDIYPELYVYKSNEPFGCIICSACKLDPDWKIVMSRELHDFNLVESDVRHLELHRGLPCYIYSAVKSASLAKAERRKAEIEATMTAMSLSDRESVTTALYDIDHLPSGLWRPRSTERLKEFRMRALAPTDSELLAWANEVRRQGEIYREIDAILKPQGSGMVKVLNWPCSMPMRPAVHDTHPKWLDVIFDGHFTVADFIQEVTTKNVFTRGPRLEEGENVE